MEGDVLFGKVAFDYLEGEGGFFELALSGRWAHLIKPGLLVLGSLDCEGGAV